MIIECTGNITLKEILEKENLDNISIMERATYPKELQEAFGVEDTLTGYCHYKDGELISDDGDSYSLEDKFYKYELGKYLGEPFLTVWQKGIYISQDENGELNIYQED